MFEELNPAVPPPTAVNESDPPADEVPASASASEFEITPETTDLPTDEDEGEQEAEASEVSEELLDWKRLRRQEFDVWLDTIDQIPQPPDQETAEEPDLYSFYRELAASNAEARKGNRRTAEAFSQWGETLSKFDADLRMLREQLARQPVGREDSLPRPWCLALIEVLDRLQRLANASQVTPPKRWWANYSEWQRAWESQRQALNILLSHTEGLVRRAGVTRIITTDQLFDPAVMTAVDTEISTSRPHQSVIEELSAGYRLNGELLRIAEVKVCVRPR